MKHRKAAAGSKGAKYPAKAAPSTTGNRPAPHDAPFNLPRPDLGRGRGQRSEDDAGEGGGHRRGGAVRQRQQPAPVKENDQGRNDDDAAADAQQTAEKAADAADSDA